MEHVDSQAGIDRGEACPEVGIPERLEQLAVREIRSHNGWVPLHLREIFEYRELLWFFLWRDLKGRYRQMALGPLWIILAPLFNMVIFTILFTKVAKLESDGLPYPVFNYSALLLWTFFAGCVETSAASLLGFRQLISKVYFPRLIVPMVAVLTATLELLISLVILVGIMFYFGTPPGWGILLLPIILIPTGLLGLALGMWAAPAVIHYRDLQNIIGFGLRGWMYLSPVVYPLSMIPEKWMPLYLLNPMTHYIETWRALLFGRPFDLMTLLIPFLCTLPLLIFAAYSFRRAERTIVDIA